MWIIVHTFTGVQDLFANLLTKKCTISIRIDAIKKYITNKIKELYKIIRPMITLAIDIGRILRIHFFEIRESNFFVIRLMRAYK